ncbi:hypothetical protein HPB51_007425 [Rhipicephalus microplus]|uniref:FMN-dependent dehydrogenase domain-containing protein n=1 Tax=Rhipicephalus microplus TaxID=6941 RepID=A0A9J6EYP2_RHIMP|nr:hypothetical protein HPB51_007425 [Rhipicephalus microplus]
MKLEEAREQEERRKAEEDKQWHSRTDGVQDRSRRKSKHRNISRGRSESFPRSPPLEKPGVSHKAPHDGGDCAQEKSKSTGPQIECLPEVVRAVAGRCEVYLDGGVRCGTDVAKALCLGAKAVFIGRPVLWGLAYKVFGAFPYLYKATYVPQLLSLA